MQDEVVEDVAVNEVIEEKVTSEESIENDNKILNIQKVSCGIKTRGCGGIPHR